MRKFIILIFTTLYLYSFTYNDTLINTQINIFPKITLLDQDISKKVENNTIVFTIIYHPSDYIKALEIKERIKSIFKNKLDSYNLAVVTKTASNIKDSDTSTAYYLLKNTPSNISKVIDIAKKHHKITFSYEKEYFLYESLISLVLKDEPYIYVNKTALKRYQINFSEIFYQIVRYQNE